MQYDIRLTPIALAVRAFFLELMEARHARRH